MVTSASSFAFRRIVLLVSVVLSTLVLCGKASRHAAADDAPNTLSEQELTDGWILLFDGKTKSGWKVANKGNWKIENGILSATQGDVGLLHTTGKFGDYLLKVDFRAAKGTNSGIFLRTPPKPKRPGSDCYELNIAPPDNPFPTGSFVQQKKVTGVAETDDWRTYEVTAQGGHFLVKLDGKTVLDFTHSKPLDRGHIGLQFNKGKIEFRNVKLKPLDTKSVLPTP